MLGIFEIIVLYTEQKIVFILGGTLHNKERKKERNKQAKKERKKQRNKERKKERSKTKKGR